VSCKRAVAGVVGQQPYSGDVVLERVGGPHGCHIQTETPIATNHYTTEIDVIMRDFDPEELCVPLPENLIHELEWEEQMTK
jgi:hypothetical protein